MDWLDINNIPMYFLAFQVIIIGFFIFIHFLLGVKRGFAKTFWLLLGNIAIVLGILYVLGFVQLNRFVNAENVRQLADLMKTYTGQDMNEALDIIEGADAMPLFIAILDLLIKISLFTVFYGIIRFLIQTIILGIPWALIIKPMIKKKKKHRLIGGFFGIIRGAFTGFILVFPVLILLNTVIGESREIEIDEYREISQQIAKANDYNLVKIINDAVQINNKGIGDMLFDLAFRSEVEQGEVIVWRSEIAWIAEGAKIILPEVLNENATYKYTLEDFQKYEGLFTKFAESQLVDSSFIPFMKIVLKTTNDTLETPMFTETELADIFTRLDETDIDITKDVSKIYDAIIDLLSIDDTSFWFNNYTDIATYLKFNQVEQQLFISALKKLVSLDVLKVGDIAAEVIIYQDFIKDEIKWLNSEQDKINYLNSIRNKIRSFEGEFVAGTLSGLANILELTIYDFPGIYIEDLNRDITLSEFIENISNLVYLLNDDARYHAWFSNIVEEIVELNVIEVLFEPILNYGLYTLLSEDTEWTQNEFALLLETVKENLVDNNDLKRELEWLADTYYEIGKLHIGKALEENESVNIALDDVLSTVEGRDQFLVMISKILEGQLISNTTNKLSTMLITKYITEPLELVETLHMAVETDDFKFTDEVQILAQVIVKFYEDGFKLGDIDNDDMLNSLLPSLLKFMKHEDNRDIILDSTILYAFMSEYISEINFLEIPSFVYETSGTYNGWIKKSELASLIDAIGILIEEMDYQNMDISILLDENTDLLNQLMPILKVVLDDSQNRDKLLASDILYYTIDKNIQDFEELEIPLDALSITAPYVSLIKRDELSKLLQSLTLIDVDFGAQKLDFSSLNGVTLYEVISLESRIIERNITNLINEQNMLDIPVISYMNPDKKDLKHNELLALSQLMIDLDLDFNKITENEILDEVKIEDLILIHYQSSYIIKSVITYGIKNGLGNPHPLALDNLYPEVLSNQEIGEIFKILEVLDENPSLSLSELLVELDPNELSFKDITDIVNAGDSVMIRGLFTQELISSSLINGISLNPIGFEEVNGTRYMTLMTYPEMIRIIDAISHFSSDVNEKLLDTVELIDLDTITTQKIMAVVDEKSYILRSIFSDYIISTIGVNRVVPNAKDNIHSTDLSQVELEKFILSLAQLDTTYNNGNPSDDQSIVDLINDLAASSNNLTIGQIQMLNNIDSLIIRKFVSEGIINSVGVNKVRLDAYELSAYQFIKYEEIEALIGALLIVAVETEGSLALALEVPIQDVTANINPTDITPSILRNILNEGSIITNRMISDIIIDSNISIPNSAFEVHPYNGNDILHQELINLSYAIEKLGMTTLDVALIDAGNTNLLQVKDALLEQSIIFKRLVSEAIVTANLDTIESHEGEEDISIDVQLDEIINLIDALNAFGINAISDAQTMDALTIYIHAQTMDEATFNTFIDYSEPYDPNDENTGLTIFKSYLIDKVNTLPDPNNFPNNFNISTRQELNELFFG